MAGGTLGALGVGQLSDRLGLQPVFLLLTLPWIAAWLLYHGRTLLPLLPRVRRIAPAPTATATATVPFAAAGAPLSSPPTD
jgi:hypothetical protein